MGSRLIGWETEVGSNADGVIATLRDIGYPVDGSGGACDYSWYCQECDTYLDDDYCYNCESSDSVVVDTDRSGSRYLHEYHCDCSFCDAYPERSNFFHFQMDCTVDGEIISKPTPWDSPHTDRAIRDLGHALITNASRTHGSVGNHVHVDIRDLKHDQLALLWQMYLLYQHEHLEPIARGAQSGVRAYNAPLRDVPLYRTKDGKTTTEPQEYDRSIRDVNGWMGVYVPNTPLSLTFSQADYKSFASSDREFFYGFDGNWLAHHGETAEFRLWNATRSPFRLRLYTALSAALVEAAAEEVDPKAGWENNVLARLTDKQRSIYEYHTTQPRPALPYNRGPRLYWEPLNERRCCETQAAEYSLAGYEVHAIKDIRSLVLS